MRLAALERRVQVEKDGCNIIESKADAREDIIELLISMGTWKSFRRNSSGLKIA